MNIGEYIAKLAKTEYTGISPGTERISALLKLLGLPQNTFPSVHIAGTNGKGSTAAMLASIIACAGYKAGLYTSPHLLDERERIRINGASISREELHSAIAHLIRFPESRRLTYFELMTAAAFMHFSVNNVDIAVCEAGLGGRYDATNVLGRVLATIITKIDYDHTELLGNSLKKITLEKAGVIRKGIPVIVSGGQKSEVMDILADSARRANAPLIRSGKYFKTGAVSYNWNKFIQTFDFSNENLTIKNIPLRLMGYHQIENAATAVETALILKNTGFNITEKNIHTGIKNTRWPARFELIKRKFNGKALEFIIDGGHNPGGIRVLRDTLQNYARAKGKKFTFIFSAMREKKHSEMAKILYPLIKKLILMRPKNPRAASFEEMERSFKPYLAGKDIFRARNFADLLKRVRNDKIVAAAGSLYLAGNLISNLGEKIEKL